MSWHYKQRFLSQEKAYHYQLFDDDSPLSVADVIQLWQQNISFGEFYNQLLADNDYSAFFWELPPLSAATLQEPFEFVLLESRTLDAVKSDTKTFAEYFVANQQGANSDVINFHNLGGDALLLVPSPMSDEQNYAHLANFVRSAPVSQRQHFWQQLGEIINAQLSSHLATELAPQSLWVSTSGLGVYWLHIRLDQQPKYYSYLPYKLAPA